MPGSSLRAVLRRGRADARGAIAIVVAIGLVILVGSAAMALDLAQVYLTRSTNQRIADQSAMAAAFAYSQSSNSLPIAKAAAASLAVTNGVPAGIASVSVSTSIVNSPSNDGNQAAKVDVTTPVSLSPFGQTTSAVTGGLTLASVNVSATAYAEIQSQVPPCIVVLGANGALATGGTNLTATGCAVASDGNVTATGGAHITAQGVYAVGTVSPSAGGGACSGSGSCVQTTGGSIVSGSTAPPDPYASSGVFNRLPTVAALTAPTYPTLPSAGSAPTGGTAYTCNGTATNLSGSYSTVTATYYPVCTSISFSGSTTISGGLQLSGNNGYALPLNFAAGTYKINGITNSGGGMAVTINVTSAPVTFQIWNGINSTQGSITFTSPATYYVQGGINNSGSSTLAFSGAGSTYYVQGGINQQSSGPMSFAGAGTYDVQGGINKSGNGALSFTNTTSATSVFYVAGGIVAGNGGTLSFPNGTYTVTSGDGTAGLDISNGGAVVTFGNGSFNIAGGIKLAGGAQLTMGGQLNANAVFQIDSAASNGNAITTGGGSTLTLGSFPNFDINGAVLLQGSVSLGTGGYTINGALNAASAGGCCITGTGVSIVTAGAITFGAGYSTINLTAPTAIDGTSQGSTSTVVLASNSTTQSEVTAGASNTTVVGAMYMPNAPLLLDGAGSLSGGGACLEVLSNSLTLNGGSGVGTNCPSLGNGATTASVALVE